MFCNSEGKINDLFRSFRFGKSTISNPIFDNSLSLEFLVFVTDRPHRGSEKWGVEYFFLRSGKFKEKISGGCFIEYEEVYLDRFYGTLKSRVEKKLAKGKNIISNIDVAGGLIIKKKYGKNALLIYIQPSSIEELQGRLEEKRTDIPGMIVNRISKAAYKLSRASKYDAIIDSDRLEDVENKTINIINKIIYTLMKIGIFPGSFNPVHIGHLAIANYVVEYGDFDEIWFLITPQNPLKKKTDLLDRTLRLAWLEKSIGSYPKFKTCTVEWEMPQPTYTINTLQRLRVMFPENNFELIIGSDNWETIHRWKDYQLILKNFKTWLYPRLGTGKIVFNHPNVHMIKGAPKMDISSTFIRKAIKRGKDIRFFLPAGVYEDIVANNVLFSEEIKETDTENL